MEIPILWLGLLPALGGQLLAIHPTDKKAVDMRKMAPNGC